MPTWNQQSLQSHYAKRIKKDSSCMQDVLGRPASAITEKDYERESLTVLTTAWICFSGEKLDQQNSGKSGMVYFSVANHFVDDRLLTTIVSKKTETILTCYHEDFNRPHKTGKYKLEQMIKYIEHLGNQRKGLMLRNFSIESFEPHDAIKQVLDAELVKIKSIPERTGP